MQRLRSEFGVYGVDSGRICVAALNSEHRHVAGIAKVVTGTRSPCRVAIGSTPMSRLQRHSSRMLHPHRSL